MTPLADLAEQVVRFDEEPGAEQEGEEVGPVRKVLGRRHHVLQQSVQRAGHQVAVLVGERLHKFIFSCKFRCKKMINLRSRPTAEYRGLSPGSRPTHSRLRRRSAR